MRSHSSVRRSAGPAFALGRRLQHRIFALAAVAALLGACGGGGEKTTAPPVPVLTTINVTLSASSVQVGQTANASATGTDQNGASIGVNAVTWSSGATNVATVDANGIVTAVSAGTATITATSAGKSGAATITVTLPNKTVVLKNYLLLPVSFTYAGGGSGVIFAGTVNGPTQMSLTVPGSANSLTYHVQPQTYADGSPMPNDIADRTITLSSDAIQTVNVTNVSAGGAQYFAADVFNSSGGGYVFAVVQNGVVACIGTVSSGGNSGARWGYYLFTSTTVARAYPVGSKCAADSYYLTWANSGLSNLTPNTGYVSLYLPYPVVRVASVTVTPSSASLELGQTRTFSATPKDSSGNTLALHPVTWSSSNPSVATVSTSGLVTAVSVGTATITASSLGTTGTSAVTVTLPVIDRVAVCDRAWPTMCLNYSQSGSAGSMTSVRATAYNSSNVDVSASCVFTWAASVPGVVTIVPSTDATHRDAVITRLVNYTTVGVTATCQGQVGVFSP